MSVNLNKSGLGKFAGMRGTIFKSEIAEYTALLSPYNGQ